MQRTLAWLLSVAVIVGAWWLAGHPGWQTGQAKPGPGQNAGQPGNAGKLYRWRDGHGVTQITRVAPKDRQFTVIDIPDDQNIIQSDAPAPEPPQ